MPRRLKLLESDIPDFSEDDDSESEDNVAFFSEGDEDDIYSRELALSNVSWQRRLLSDGSPRPDFILRNQQEKGYINPCANYVEEAKKPDLKTIAINWMVPYSRLVFWKRQQNWDDQRKRYWLDESKRVLEMSQVDIAAMRGDALKRAVRNFRAMQVYAVNMASYGKKTKLVGTEPIEVDYEPKDLQNLSKVLFDSHRGELAALGLNLVVQRDATETPEDEQMAPINMMVFNMPATEDETRRLIALPREALPSPVLEVSGETVEGVVVSDETGETEPKSKSSKR